MTIFEEKYPDHLMWLYSKEDTLSEKNRACQTLVRLHTSNPCRCTGLDVQATPRYYPRFPAWVKNFHGLKKFLRIFGGLWFAQVKNFHGLDGSKPCTCMGWNFYNSCIYKGLEFFNSCTSLFHAVGRAKMILTRVDTRVWTRHLYTGTPMHMYRLKIFL